MQTNILVIDDHPLVASSFKQLASTLQWQADIAIDAQEALLALAENQYTLIILDIGLPHMDGKSLLPIIRAKKITTPILAISGTPDTSVILWMLDHGAQGFICKTEKAEQICNAMKTVHAGGTVIPKNILDQHTQHKKSNDDVADYLGITPKQIEVLQLMAPGKSNKQIAHILGVAESTVSTHLKRLYHILKVHNRLECISHAKDLGLI